MANNGNGSSTSGQTGERSADRSNPGRFYQAGQYGLILFLFIGSLLFLVVSVGPGVIKLFENGMPVFLQAVKSGHPPVWIFSAFISGLMFWLGFLLLVKAEAKPASPAGQAPMPPPLNRVQDVSFQLASPLDMINPAVEHASISDMVIDFFHKHEWIFEKSEDSTAFLSEIRGTNGVFQCIAQVDEPDGVTFFVVLGSKIPIAKVPKVIEFLNRVNYQLYAGNFEMDSRDAEIRYKDTIDARGGVLTPLMLEIMFFRNLFTIDEYVPAIMNVAYTEITPAQALMQMAKSREVES